MDSPGVITRERDFTFNPTSATSNITAAVGLFNWGPVDEIIRISTNESELVQKVGQPDNITAPFFLSAANYLLYSAPLYLVRAVDKDTAKNSVPVGESPILIKNQNAYDAATLSVSFIGRYPGQLANNITVSAATADGLADWDYTDEFEYDPADGEFNLVVVDRTGEISGIAGTVLERFQGLSKNPGHKRPDGTPAYVKEVLSASSRFILSGDLDAIVFTESDSVGIYEVDLQGGVDGNVIEDADFDTAVSVLSPDNLNIIRMYAGPVPPSTAAKLVDLASTRTDSIAFVAPELSDVYNAVDPVSNIIGFFESTLNKNTSYGFAVDNWKVVYDKYNNTNVWIPCDSDAAGLHARIFVEAEPWFSPAGLNNGQLKNVSRLAWNSSNSDRGELYKKSINSIVAFENEGVTLFGDKTMLKSPSAFSRINVRTLFIVIRKTIAQSARYRLFDLNDFVTRTLFKNGVERYLETVQGRRGISPSANGGPGYRVICDETNNTEEVIASNGFVGSVSVIPARSINFITLDFNAVGGDVNFTESEG